MQDTFDCIIIGSGAGGAAAAYHLVNAGKRVLVLEKGPPLPLDGSTLSAMAVLGEVRFRNCEVWLDRNRRPFVPQEYYNLGGKTKWYGAALLRFNPHEFMDDSGHQCPGWPIAYNDLVPYYDEAEGLLGVRSFEMEPDLKRVVARLQKHEPEWRSQPMPLGLSSEILNHPEEATRFDGFASVAGLKSDAQVCFLDKVRGHPNFEILTGKPVASLISDAGSPERITGVECEDGGRYRADCVLLAAGALSSPRLLQRYLDTTGLSSRLPSAPLVGRFYKCHLLTAVVGLSRARVTDQIRKTVVMVNERFPHSSVQPLGATDGEIVATELPRFAPRWSANLVGDRAYGFFLQTEDGSHPDNRVVWRADGSDLPQLDYDPDRIAPARDEHRRLVSAFRRALLRAGLVGIVKPIPLDGTAHACGTLIAGNDPMHSVVNADGQVHGMENLYVVDGSVLPRSSRVNPALTIYAWSLRVADGLAGRQAARGSETIGTGQPHEAGEAV